eukprot:1140502-Pelagomonas_calceolata.AAC.2
MVSLTSELARASPKKLIWLAFTKLGAHRRERMRIWMAVKEAFEQLNQRGGKRSVCDRSC